MILESLLILFIIGAVYYVWKTWKYQLFAWQFPGPFNVPYLGTCFHFLKYEGLDVTQQLFKKYGLRSKVWVYNHLVYITSHPKDLRIILNSNDCLDKARLFYGSAMVLVGESFVHSPTDKWKRERRLFNQGFTKAILDSYFGQLSNRTETLIATLKDEFGDEPRDIFEFMAIYAHDAFCVNFMQFDHEDVIAEEKFGVKSKLFNTQLNKRMVEPWMHWDSIYFKTHDGKVMKRISAKILVFIRKILDEKMQFYQHYGLNEDKKRRNFIEIVLDPDNQFSKNDAQDHIVGLMIAGSDSSTLFLSFIALVLGGQPKIQQRLYEEIMTVIGHKRVITLDDLPNLKYVERFIYEMLRLFPILPIIGRQTSKDIALDDCTIPAGTAIVMSILNLHRQPQYWPEPLKFDPDRFLPEECAKRDPYAYIPFSMGTRNCIGLRYGMMVMKTAVTSLVMNFEFQSKYSSIEQMELLSFSMLNIKGGFICSIKERAE